MFSKQHLSEADPAVWAAISAEFEREEMNLELIASEITQALQCLRHKLRF